MFNVTNCNVIITSSLKTIDIFMNSGSIFEFKKELSTLHWCIWCHYCNKTKRKNYFM